MTGEEEIWSHTDLWDFQANVDGALVGFEVLRDVAEARDPALVTTLDERFDALNALLATHGSLEAGFKHYDELAQDEVQALAAAVDALSEPLSRLTSDDHGRRMSERRGISRRAFLGAAAGSAAALGVGGLAATGGLGRLAAIGGSPAPRRRRPARRTYPFAGSHQAGIVTPAQDRMYTAAYDLTTTSRDELVALLRTWTTVAARLTAGLPAGPLGPTSGPVRRPARRHRRGAGARRRGPHDHHRLRARRCSSDRPARRRPVRDRRPDPGGARRAPPLLRRRPRPACAATATSSSRPARTTPRSRCTRSATSPGSPSAPRASAGRSSGSAGPRPRRPRRPRPATSWASRTGPRTSRPRTTGPARGSRLGPAGRRRRARGVARGRLVHGRPADPDAHRDVGPHVAPRAGGDLRADQGRGRAAVGRHRVHGAGLRGPRAPTARR